MCLHRPPRRAHVAAASRDALARGLPHDSAIRSGRKSQGRAGCVYPARKVFSPAGSHSASAAGRRTHSSCPPCRRWRIAASCSVVCRARTASSGLVHPWCQGPSGPAALPNAFRAEAASSRSASVTTMASASYPVLASCCLMLAPPAKQLAATTAAAATTSSGNTVRSSCSGSFRTRRNNRSKTSRRWQPCSSARPSRKSRAPSLSKGPVPKVPTAADCCGRSGRRHLAPVATTWRATR
jgi:hypothetical protein